MLLRGRRSAVQCFPKFPVPHNCVNDQVHLQRLLSPRRGFCLSQSRFPPLKRWAISGRPCGTADVPSPAGRKRIAHRFIGVGNRTPTKQVPAGTKENRLQMTHFDPGESLNDLRLQMYFQQFNHAPSPTDVGRVPSHGVFRRYPPPRLCTRSCNLNSSFYFYNSFFNCAVIFPGKVTNRLLLPKSFA
jgi:hypothetical protein